jgi:hypothetical protein
MVSRFGLKETCDKFLSTLQPPPFFAPFLQLFVCGLFVPGFHRRCNEGCDTEVTPKAVIPRAALSLSLNPTFTFTSTVRTSGVSFLFAIIHTRFFLNPWISLDLNRSCASIQSTRVKTAPYIGSSRIDADQRFYRVNCLSSTDR